MSQSFVNRSELPALLAADLLEPADPNWRRELAPELSYNRHAGPARSDARSAAVALVLCWDDSSWSLPLTVRNAALTRHAGQVSLPGGLLEADETPCEAAQRELAEELGQSGPLKWLGELAPLFVFASNTIVTPCVAAVDHWPPWRPDAAEVDRVLRLRLGELIEQPPAAPLLVERGPFRFLAPQVVVESFPTWGATAVLLGELRGRLRRIAAAAK